MCAWSLEDCLLNCTLYSDYSQSKAYSSKSIVLVILLKSRKQSFGTFALIVIWPCIVKSKWYTCFALWVVICSWRRISVPYKYNYHSYVIEVGTGRPLWLQWYTLLILWKDSIQWFSMLRFKWNRFQSEAEIVNLYGFPWPWQSIQNWFKRKTRLCWELSSHKRKNLTPFIC